MLEAMAREYWNQRWLDGPNLCASH